MAAAPRPREAHEAPISPRPKEACGAPALGEEAAAALLMEYKLYQRPMGGVGSSQVSVQDKTPQHQETARSGRGDLEMVSFAENVLPGVSAGSVRFMPGVTLEPPQGSYAVETVLTDL